MVNLPHTLTAVGLAAALAAGCSSGPELPPFPPLHPVKGTVRKGGKPADGGMVRFTPTPDSDDFMISAPVAADGTFTVTTVRRTDRAGERRPGAPEGKYRVTFMPKSVDQTAEAVAGPVELPKPVTVSAGENDVPLDVPGR